MKLEDFDFRVWSKKDRKYINKDYPIGFGLGENREREVLAFFTKYTQIKHIDTIGKIQHHTMTPTFYKSDDLEIELFTGFYDRAGKKIYEGDVLGFDDRGDYVNCSVFYNKYEAMFVDIVHEEEDSVPYAIPMIKLVHETARRGFSVVGNIHRNLEILIPKDSK